MTTQHPVEFDADSIASSPRSDHFHEPLPRVRFMCSFGGRILPRPHDNQLRYVGGDTRIVAVNRSISFSGLLLKLSKLSGTTNITVKYQLPNEDLDALISVTTDEDVENMMEEYERVAQNQNPRSARLRLFLFVKGEDSRAGSISSLLDGSANRESWFVDALNSGVDRLERGRSEASSMISEVPDYLFGLENSDEAQIREPRSKLRPVVNDSVSCSDPGSPAPAVSSPFCSTSSAPNVPSMPNLPPVKTKPDNPVPVVESKEYHIDGFQPGNPAGQAPHYPLDSTYPGHSVQPVPVYYYPGPIPVQHGQVPVQPVTIQAPYMQPYPAVVPAQVPVGYHQVVTGSAQAYAGGLRPVGGMHPYEAAPTVLPDSMRQQAYQAVPNSGGATVYSVMAMASGDESQRPGNEYGTVRGTNME
ncbi:uncharacterized protein LOC129306439 [Prosopis cineraria]|uniref:uncharacterized protein LOC129306439 n=1 Tax=Prosopis cineraria TaxID=364024 RepID=UPI00240ED170|nr:uncharacterized protein LOC129306439 [Prosopis cineraria]